MQFENIAIVNSFSNKPVPAVSGGGVETLIDLLIDSNEKNPKAKIFILTYAHPEIPDHLIIKYNTHFIFINTTSLKAKAYSVVRKILIKISSRRYRLPSYYEYSVIKILSKCRFDKVVIENDIKLVNVLPKKICNNLILHLHNDLYNVNKNNIKFLYDKLEKIFVVSNYIKSRVLTIKEIPEGKVKVLKNCINTEKLAFEITQEEKDIIRSKYSITKGDFVIFFSGRIDQRKGVIELLNAFEKVQKQRNNVKILILGAPNVNDVESMNYFSKIVKLQNKDEENIKLLGFKNQDDLSWLLHASDVAVVPSIWQEPAGLTIIEAMASGVPLITTNVGGIPEYTNNNCSILLDVDEQFVDNLSMAIIRLIDDEKMRKDLAIKAQQLSKQYNPSNYLNNFIEAISN